MATIIRAGLDACAKINLFLEVERRRDDGYHDIVSVFQEVSLADRLEAESVAGADLTLTAEGREVPLDASNLILRAVDALRQRLGVRKGLRLHLQKRIPLGAGLGGGSSDAAAALRLATEVWQTPRDVATLAEVASGLGSDIPFFLTGGACLCEGRGERIRPLPTLPLPEAVLVLPPWGISTAGAYAALAGERLGTLPAQAFLDAVDRGERRAVLSEARNRFEAAAARLEPRQAALLAALRARGDLTALMSGSGSAVWCAANDDRSSEELARALERVCDTELFGSEICPVSGVHRRGGTWS